MAKRSSKYFSYETTEWKIEKQKRHIEKNPGKIAVFALGKMLGWINQISVGSTIEYGYYTDNQIFGCVKKIFWLIKFGGLYQLLWLIQPNTMVNLKKRFCLSK